MDATPALALHPCQRCGACCASYIVAFHWSETLPEVLAVPERLAGSLDPHRLAMRGTHSDTPRCVALDGDIGGFTRCTIYAQRPSPCRALVASWENGMPSPQCDRARIRHGLAPLQPGDWPAAMHDVPHTSDVATTEPPHA